MAEARLVFVTDREYASLHALLRVAAAKAAHFERVATQLAADLEQEKADRRRWESIAVEALADLELLDGGA